MLKLTLKPGEYIDIGENIKVIFSGGSANNIHLVIDAPREVNIARNATKANDLRYREPELSMAAKRQIREILSRERKNR